MVRDDPKVENWQSRFSPDMKWFAYIVERVRQFRGLRRTPSCDRRAMAGIHTRRGSAALAQQQGTHLPQLCRWDTDVDVTDARRLAERQPRSALSHQCARRPGSGDYAMSADGERVVVNTFISDAVIPPIDVVVNWPGLMKN